MDEGAAVISGHYFRQIQDPRGMDTANLPPNDASLLMLLSHHVVERFVRLSHTTLNPIPLCLSSPEEAEEPSPNPGHPACAEYADSDYCRESWQLHLAELENQPRTHWHKCDCGILCAFVAVRDRGKCLAAVKLACANTMAEEEFERQVELLDTLVKDFVISEAGFLDRLANAKLAPVQVGATSPQDAEERIPASPRHPQILRAIEYIEEHLADPGLTVGCVARALDIHPNYLSHLFAAQVGQRMGRFIVARRVEMAKGLLATTDWQIKRIARDTGHANPNWFCYVFSAQTGFTPSEYRRQSRGQ